MDIYKVCFQDYRQLYNLHYFWWESVFAFFSLPLSQSPICFYHRFSVSLLSAI